MEEERNKKIKYIENQRRDIMKYLEESNHMGIYDYGYYRRYWYPTIIPEYEKYKYIFNYMRNYICFTWLYRKTIIYSKSEVNKINYRNALLRELYRHYDYPYYMRVLLENSIYGMIEPYNSIKRYDEWNCFLTSLMEKLIC